METEEKTETVNVDEAFIIKTDPGELCRLCANTDNQLIPIFRGEGLEHNLSNKIEKHLPIIKVSYRNIHCFALGFLVIQLLLFSGYRS